MASRQVGKLLLRSIACAVRLVHSRFDRDLPAHHAFRVIQTHVPRLTPAQETPGVDMPYGSMVRRRLQTGVLLSRRWGDVLKWSLLKQHAP